MKGDTIPSFAILTDEPNELVAPFHDRMPVVLDDPEAWLETDTTLDNIKPLGKEAFEVRSVNRGEQADREKSRRDRSAAGPRAPSRQPRERHPGLKSRKRSGALPRQVPAAWHSPRIQADRHRDVPARSPIHGRDRIFLLAHHGSPPRCGDCAE